MTPLDVACSQGITAIVKILLAFCGAGENAATKRGLTALMRPAGGRKELIAAGAKADATMMGGGRSAADFAGDRGFLNLAAQLRRKASRLR